MSKTSVLIPNDLHESHFCKSAKNPCGEKSFLPTVLLVPETSEDGQVTLIARDMSTIDNPISALCYTDFQLSTLLKHGIKPTALQISPDLRIGSDAMIDAFHQRLESVADKLFVEPEN